MPTAPFSWAVRRLAPRCRGLARDDAVERALGVVLARLVVEDQDDLAPHVQISVIVVPGSGALMPKPTKTSRPAACRSPGGLKRQGNKLLAGVKPRLPVSLEPQAAGRAEGRRHEVEALEVRPVGPDSLESEPLEPRGDELGGQVVLGGRGQSAAEPVTRQEEQVGLHVPLADRIIPGRGRLTPAGPRVRSAASRSGSRDSARDLLLRSVEDRPASYSSDWPGANGTNTSAMECRSSPRIGP